MDDDTTPQPKPPKRPKLASSPATGLDGIVVGPTTTTTAINLLDLMDPLLRTISTYLSNEDLMNVTLVSKRTNDIFPRATTYESRALGTIIPVLHMRPSNNAHDDGHYGGLGRLDKLLHQLQLHSNRNLLQQYQHASMTDYHEFKVTTYLKYKDLVKRIKTHGPQIEGITSLDFCFSTTTTTTVTSNNYERDNYVLKTLTHLLPSLREVDLTNTVVGGNTIQSFFQNCSRLEKFTYHIKNGTDFIITLYIDGSTMKAANNLKELSMDDSTFIISDHEVKMMSDLSENADDAVGPKTFLLHECSSKVLERVSLRNSNFFAYGAGKLSTDAIPQKALMKFIRNSPTTMRWFRSNLTKDNIKILQQERPDIEFVS